MIRKLLSLTILLACIAVLQVGCGSDDDGTTEPPAVTEPRIVVSAHQDPTLANAIDSPVWDSVAAVTVHLGTAAAYNADLATADTVVNIKALVADDSLLYIWVRWGDNSKSDRFGQLHATWANRVEWEKDTIFSNEDRFYVIFDNGGTDGADCASFCHAIGDTSSAGKRFYGAAGDDADIWRWLANRTGTAGFAEDMHITDIKVSPDPQARPNDSLYFGNYDHINLQPINMHQDGILFTDPALLEGEWIPFNASLDWVTFNPPNPPVGKYVPGQYFHNNSLSQGSRWDVRTASEYAGSKWTVVFRRAMTTADVADLDFGAITDSVAITIAITNNIGMKHYGRAPLYMIF